MKIDINKLKNTNRPILKYSGIYPYGCYVSWPVPKNGNANSAEVLYGRTKTGGYVALPGVKQ